MKFKFEDNRGPKIDIQECSQEKVTQHLLRASTSIEKLDLAVVGD